jgi:alpha-D-xyloside xylohydrolase
VAVAQSTAGIDWGNIELRVFSADGGPARGWFALPGGELAELRLRAADGSYALERDPLAGKVRWRVRRAGSG